MSATRWEAADQRRSKSRGRRRQWTSLVVSMLLSQKLASSLDYCASYARWQLDGTATVEATAAAAAVAAADNEMLQLCVRAACSFTARQTHPFVNDILTTFERLNNTSSSQTHNVTHCLVANKHRYTFTLYTPKGPSQTGEGRGGRPLRFNNKIFEKSRLSGIAYLNNTQHWFYYTLAAEKPNI